MRTEFLETIDTEAGKIKISFTAETFGEVFFRFEDVEDEKTLCFFLAVNQAKSLLAPLAEVIHAAKLMEGSKHEDN